MSIRDIAIDKKYSAVDWKDIGSSNSYNIKTEYENFFKQKFRFTEKLKVAIDCGGGSTTLSAPEVFTSLGI
ncbi:unnamed protein product, partial [marine sediment metagenome]